MNEEEREAKKSLFLKIGVSIIIVIIFFFWLANLKGIFRSSNSKKDDTTMQKINEDIKDLEKRLNQIEATTTKSTFVDELINKTDKMASSSASISTSTAIEEIKKELIDLTKSTTTSPKVACPPYINCMPTIGEMKPCVIPAGCEDITQIAY